MKNILYTIQVYIKSLISHTWYVFFPVHRYTAWEKDGVTRLSVIEVDTCMHKVASGYYKSVLIRFPKPGQELWLAKISLNIVHLFLYIHV